MIKLLMTGTTMPNTATNSNPRGLLDAKAIGAIKPFNPNQAIANGTLRLNTPTASIAETPAIKAGPNINNGLFKRLGN